MFNPYSLDNKTILITGASSGIGRATAIACSKLGASVILVGRNKERLNETYSLLASEKDSPHSSFVADLTNADAIKSLVGAIPEIDGCALNAGIGLTLPISFFSSDEAERIFAVNSFSPMLLLRTLLRNKKLKKDSSVVFTLSIAGLFNYLVGNSIYGSSKASLETFMKYAALELAPKKIRCNAVSPGMVNTEFIAKRNFSEEDLQRDMSMYPLKRYGEPEEVAYAIIYLLSDASKWVTGSNLVIDGGRSLK